MKLEELQAKFRQNPPTFYKVGNDKVIEYKTFIHKQIKVNGKLEKNFPDVSEVDKSKAFTVGFSKPNGWKPNYALPFISITGIDEKNNKLILEKPKETGGYDLPNTWFWIDGDFYTTKEAAQLKVSQHKQPETNPIQELKKQVKEMRELAHNCLDSEMIECFADIAKEMNKQIKRIENISQKIKMDKVEKIKAEIERRKSLADKQKSNTYFFARSDAYAELLNFIDSLEE